MSRSKLSAESLSPPEFCIDRNLGRTVPARLVELGWKIHRIADMFPDDAQNTPDEIWVEAALLRGWVPLCKDGRIKGRAHERAPLEVHRGVLFYLDNQQLVVEQMVERIHRAQESIYRAASRGPAAYAIGADGIRRTWP